VWTHFKKVQGVKDFAICTLCLKRKITRWIKLSDGSTSSLHYHLNHTHPANEEKQGLIEHLFAKRSIDAARYEEDLARFIAMDNMPLSVVESPQFRKLSKFAAVDRDRIERVLVALNSEVEKHILQAVQLASGLSFTTDGSSFYTSHHYIAFTCHFIANWKLYSVLVGFSNVTESETANFLSGMLGTVIQHWNRDGKATAVVTDNGANFLAGVNALVKEEKVEESLRCYCHNFHLVIKDAVSGTPAISELLDRCRKIVSTINNSKGLFKIYTALAKQDDCKFMALIRDVPTRWNTIFFMLERLLLMKYAIVNMKATDELKDLALKEPEWEILVQLCRILDPVRECSKLLEGELYPTLG
jgi:hypothetical protein